VSDVATVQELVALRCPGVRTLADATYDSPYIPYDLAVQDDVPPRWRYSPQDSVLQEEMLLYRSGLQVACNMQKPAGLRRRLYKLHESAAGLRAWFWGAHAEFLLLWGSEACAPATTFAMLGVEGVLREGLEERVGFAELLIMAYNLLLRRHCLQQP
jgi:hypothetical protein